jgi:coenzyme Q-binding protein COQ10
VVEARSGDRPNNNISTREVVPAVTDEEDVFDYLSTRWELVPLPPPPPPSTAAGGGALQQRTKVQLDIRFQFRNQFHAAVMSAIEDKVAGAMIEAFEHRIHGMGERIIKG